jgi:hypothetical protein
MTSINKTLKSNCSVSEVAKERKSGTTNPTTNTPKDINIAKTIKPIVCGSFKILRLMIENTEAKSNKSVDNSSKFILL